MAELNVDQHGRVIWAVSEHDRVLCGFVLSNAPVAMCMGPIGSGKTVGCILKMWRHANEQRPDRSGVRRTRWAVVRNNYPALRTTTIRTFLDVFPEKTFGVLKWTQPPHQIVRSGNVEMAVDFLALDKPEDIAKLRSAEYTGVFFNELSFIDNKEIFDEATSRVGRYPAIRDGGATWSGVFADTNAPSQDHWLSVMAGLVPMPEGLLSSERAALTWPSSWDYFVQPPGLLENRRADGSLAGYDVNPQAENQEWLPSKYYGNLIAGKSDSWIKSRVLNRVAVVVDGEPVWPAFRREWHVAEAALRPTPGHEMWIACDFGRSPAALFAQFVNNRIIVLHELQGSNISSIAFAPLVKKTLEQKFWGYSFQATGDPKGADKNQADERTSFEVFRSVGIPMRPAPVKMNAIETRLSAVDSVLNSLHDGKSRLLISPTCRTLITALEGAYCFERKVHSSEIRTEPAKNKYSHVADALQYLCISLGEGRRMVGLEPIGNLKPKRVWHGRRTMRRVLA
jgi:hypothetical protein